MLKSCAQKKERQPQRGHKRKDRAHRKSLGFRAKPAPKSSSAAFVPPVARRLQDLKNKPKLTMPMSPKLASKARSQRRSLLGENNTAMQN